MDPNELLELLEACDELNIDELIEDLQNYLIVKKKEWIEQNLVYIHKISPRDHSAIEYLLRRGKRQLEAYQDDSVKDIRL